MFYRLKDKLARARFDWAVRGILDTPPVRTSRDSHLIVLSQLQHKDLFLYLVALKSFARHVPVQNVVVLNDGTLTAADAAILRAQISGVHIASVTEFRSEACPVGGCWERLLAIVEYSKDHFVIQLDSDTITLGRPNEVIDNIEHGRSFTIGTWDNQVIEPMSVCSERVRQRTDVTPASHIQLAAEARFLDLEKCPRLRYVRGCAGFSGFAPGSVPEAFVDEFSSAMRSLMGDRWNEWGSEQVMSNVAVANSPKATVLPHPLYSDCRKMTEATRFIHFIGDCRFNSGIYSHHARQLIAGLMSAP